MMCVMMCGRDAVGAVSHFRIHFATVHLDWVKPVEFLLKSFILSHTCIGIHAIRLSDTVAGYED